MVPYHVYLIKVEETIKGNTKAGQEIEIRIPKDAEEIESTEEGIYFLALMDNSQPYIIVNPLQGSIPVDENQLQLTKVTQVFFTEEEISIRNGSEIFEEKKESKTLPLEEAISERTKVVDQEKK